MDNLYATIAGSTAQLAFVEGKLLAYENMKIIQTEEKAARSHLRTYIATLDIAKAFPSVEH